MPGSPKANRGPTAGPENRRAILNAAREVFAEEGLRAPLSAVARRAGVGQGSLYRHFPDRLALAVAVFDENVTLLEEFASDESRTFDDLLRAVSEQAVASTALIEVTLIDQGDGRGLPIRARVEAVVERMLRRDHESGRIAAGVGVEEAFLAVSMLGLVVAAADDEAKDAVAAKARAIFHAAFRPE